MNKWAIMYRPYLMEFLENVSKFCNVYVSLLLPFQTKIWHLFCYFRFIHMELKCMLKKSLKVLIKREESYRKSTFHFYLKDLKKFLTKILYSEKNM